MSSRFVANATFPGAAGPGPRAVRRAAAVAACLGFGLHAGACAAQGSVTLYGLLDTSIEVTNPGSGWVPRLDSGAYRGSRIGVRGSEPIGGGLRVLFALESGFGSNDGTLSTAGTLFNRQAWVGLGAPWGELRVGRQYSPIYIPFKGQIDAFGAGTIASGLNNLSKITPYESDAITYLSPDFHGFTTTLMVSLRDPSGGGANGLGGSIATFAYRHGPLRIAFAHQQTNDAGALRANLGGLSWAFGRLTAFVSMFNGDGGTPRYHDDGLAVSMRYAMTARLRASLGYAYLRDRSGSGDDADQFSAAAEYDLSPRVLLYASAGWLRNRGAATFTLRGVNVTGLAPAYPGATVKGVQLGMIERF
ncbi:porin [Burkholderia plantarii]|uniref:porin n=1 Tax=Burkholderia plantarii TaxID=41899 RepID=UPI001F5B2650|nr:porin [Burkholderia plantarii]